MSYVRQRYLEAYRGEGEKYEEKEVGKIGQEGAIKEEVVMGKKEWKKIGNIRSMNIFGQISAL